MMFNMTVPEKIYFIINPVQPVTGKIEQHKSNYYGDPSGLKMVNGNSCYQPFVT